MKGGILFLVLLGLGLATGCGGSEVSTSGDPGGGGDGGSGAGNGSGANGGAGGETWTGYQTTTPGGVGGGTPGCAFSEDVGFYLVQFGSTTGTVSSVTPESLVVDTGEPTNWTLKWAGSDLTVSTGFSPGQVVQVDVTGEGWDSVATQTELVAAFSQQHFGFADAPGPPPKGAVTFDLGGACHGGGGTWYYDLVATAGDETITVKPGELGTVGEYEVFNAGIQSWSGNGEHYAFEALTVRGPVSPP